MSKSESYCGDFASESRQYSASRAPAAENAGHDTHTLPMVLNRPARTGPVCQEASELFWAFGLWAWPARLYQSTAIEKSSETRETKHQGPSLPAYTRGTQGSGGPNPYRASNNDTSFGIGSILFWVTETDFPLDEKEVKKGTGAGQADVHHHTRTAPPRPWSIAATVALLPVAESLCAKRLVEELS